MYANVRLRLDTIGYREHLVENTPLAKDHFLIMSLLLRYFDKFSENRR